MRRAKVADFGVSEAQLLELRQLLQNRPLHDRLIEDEASETAVACPSVSRTWAPIDRSHFATVSSPFPFTDAGSSACLALRFDGSSAARQMPGMRACSSFTPEPVTRL